MTLTEAVRHCLSNYATFSGRAGRSEFWYFALALVLAGIVAEVLDLIIGYPILQVIVSLGSILPNIAVTTRRLHDRDRSGWWQLILLIPLIGWIWLLVWLAQPSTPGANRFGYGPATA